MTHTRYPDTQLLINNQWVDAADGKTLDVVNPATGKAIGKVACAGRRDLDRALAATQQGFATWRAIPAAQRAVIMRRAGALLRERAGDIARLMTLEQGKPLAEARAEVTAAAGVIDWFADEGLRAYGRIVPTRNPAALQMVLKEPVGPVAAFTPWNFPINQVVRKLSAALAAGCSFLCKPPEETPASPAALIQAFVDAGVPEGVLGVVYGIPADISNYLIPHPVIRKVTFTGSTAVGKQLAALAGAHMKRVTMELGGHAPVIVAQDADIDLAVQTIGPAKFRNAGQVCISPTRLLVHRSVVAEFTQALVHYAESVKVGDGLEEQTTMGPLANLRRVAAVTDFVADATAHGAEVLTGGTRLGTSGNFFAPTILAKVDTGTKLFNTEPFGPIAGIQAFDTLETAIEEANRLPYGLSAYAFTRSFKHVQTLINGIEAGMVWINQAATPSPELPFGGVKDSGYGSEGGPEAIEAYLNRKTVSVVGV